MDGYQFQKFVANLFKNLGFVNIKVGPPTADGGIDITMEQRTDLGSVNYTIECKHHPKSSIGRPVVQKLHSAVLYTPVLDKGIIVTSGHFSSQAIKYAEEVGIELIDIEKLTKLANKVGLSLKTEPFVPVENAFPLSNRTEIINKLLTFLQKDLTGFNRESIKIDDVSLSLISSFMVDYNIDASFSTSVGLIHSLNKTGTVFLDGKNGNPVTSIITNPILPLRDKVSRIDDRTIKEVRLQEKGVFDRSHKEIETKVKHFLRGVYTENVSYYGANNRRYTKTCTPKKNDILIKEIQRVYIPIWSFGFSILNSKYVLAAQETLGELNIVPEKIAHATGSGFTQYPDSCMICSKHLVQPKFVCSQCGIIICDDDSSECKLCGKVICKEHTISKRKYLIMSDKYCEQCAKTAGV